MSFKKDLASSRRDAEEINSLVDQIQSKLKSAKFNPIDENAGDNLKTYVDNLSKVNSIADQLKQHQEQIAIHGKKSKGFSAEQLKSLAKESKFRTKNLKILAKTAKEELELQRINLLNNLALAQTAKQEEKILKKIEANKNAQEKLNNSIKDAEKLTKKLNQEARKAQVAEGFEKAGKTIKSLPNPLGDILNLTQMFSKMLMLPVTSAIELDKELGEAAKSMNQTYEAAAKSRLAMVEVAEATGNILVNATHMQKTFLALNKSMGLSVEFEKLGKELQKDIGFMAMLENFAGLTADESNSILKLSLLNGKSAEKTAGTLMATYRIESLKHGLVVDEKDALREISKISAAIKISTDGGAEGLAKALAAAKGLGVSLKDVEGTASSLLNFEQSIEKELSAELVTGKQLNLEKARQAALNNDLKTLAEEIKLQVGGEAEFAAMNRIQQESLAAAVGMNRDQLAEALMNQEEGKALSEGAIDAETAKYNQMVAQKGVQGAMLEMSKQQLAIQSKQASSQEKIDAAMLKQKDKITKEIIPGMVTFNGMIEKLLGMFDSVLEKLGGWRTIIIAIAGIFAVQMAMSLGKIVLGLGSAIIKTLSWAAASATQAIAAITSASAATLGIAIPAILAGIGLGAAAMYSYMDDGVISPSSGGGGYGDRVLFGPEGAIAFNNKDTIVAGTNLFKANDAAFAGEGQMSINNSSMVDAIKQNNDAMLAMASRPVVVQVDGVSIIEQTSESNPNEDGRASAVNSYKLQ